MSKNASAALIAFLAQNDLAFFGADIYTFTLQNGTVFRASTFDRPISYGGNTYPVARAAVNQNYSIAGITQASQAIVTTIAGNVTTVGDNVKFSGVGGMTQINGLEGIVTAISPTGFVVGINSTSFSAFTSGGHVTLLSVPTLTRSKVSMGVGLTGSKIDVTMQADPLALVAGQPILQAMATGLFDNALVTIRRCFMTYGDVHFNDGVLNGPAICNLTGAATGTGDGTILWFQGNVGSIGSIEALKATFEVRDVIYQLNRPTPKNLIGPGCWHQLFDQGCTLSPSGSAGGNQFTMTGAVVAGSTSQVINTNISTSAGSVAPSSAPSLSDSGNTGVPLAAGTYFVVVTYVNALGESLPSPESFIALAPNHVPIVAHPSSVTGATGWNVYIGLESGNEQLQNGTPINFSTNYSVPNTGISLSGRVPPTFASNGYWSQGTVLFTSGVLSGLSAYVESSAPGGSGDVLSLRVPMIATPAISDTLSVTVGCDKSFNKCNQFFQNTVHLSSFPLVPVPEQGFALVPLLFIHNHWVIFGLLIVLIIGHLILERRKT